MRVRFNLTKEVGPWHAEEQPEKADRSNNANLTPDLAHLEPWGPMSDYVSPPIPHHTNKMFLTYGSVRQITSGKFTKWRNFGFKCALKLSFMALELKESASHTFRAFF